jgi:serine/threonine protein kinase
VYTCAHLPFSFPERIALDYFRQTCAGLDYLHYNNVRSRQTAALNSLTCHGLSCHLACMAGTLF